MEASWGTAEYEVIRAGCQRSAAVIAPLLYSYLPGLEHVIDIGAGEGWFAHAFAAFGCKAVAVEKEIPEGAAPDVRWHEHDLLSPVPPRPDEEYDLALCLEVAEHLPAYRADSLIAGLCGLAPIVAFSAAIPGQSGHGHINLHWPDYWTRLFANHDYVVTGALRHELWANPDVEAWYAQNLLLAAHTDHTYDTLEPLFNWDTPPASLVHPTIYQWALNGWGIRS